MQNDINNIEKTDAFSELFRQKLENHQTAVEPEAWNEIEARLNKEKRRVIPLWYWLSGGVAVAVLTLIFTLSPFPESKTYTRTGTKAKIQKAITQRQVLISGNQYHAITQQTNNKSTRKPQNHSTSKPVPEPAIKVQELTSTNQPFEQKTHQPTEQSDVQFTESTNQPTNQRNEVTSRIQDQSINQSTNEQPELKRKKAEWLLAASFESGSGETNGINGVGTTLANNNIVNASTTYTSIMTPNDFSNITYNPPLSFGIFVRKKLDNNFSLESGFVYTYLLTSFNNTNEQQNNAKLHLHYIGIPLNVVVTIWKNPKWEIYSSGGVMIEKGIRSVYIQNQIGGNQITTTTASSTIEGFQWSVDASVGITYKIEPNVGLFFEPKIAYYFKNNQPLSIRTVYPETIGLAAGIRFLLK